MPLIANSLLIFDLNFTLRTSENRKLQFSSSSAPLSSTDQTEVDCSPGNENSEQHNLLEQLQSRYRQMEERITCPICIDNHIKLVFQCGHASCIDCSAALKTCPICRQTIRERIQLFVWAPLSSQLLNNPKRMSARAGAGPGDLFLSVAPTRSPPAHVIKHSHCFTIKRCVTSLRVSFWYKQRGQERAGALRSESKALELKRKRQRKVLVRWEREVPPLASTPCNMSYVCLASPVYKAAQNRSLSSRPSARPVNLLWFVL